MSCLNVLDSFVDRTLWLAKNLIAGGWWRNNFVHSPVEAIHGLTYR